MDGVDHHSAVGDALGILIQGLTPFVERVFADALLPGCRLRPLGSYSGGFSQLRYRLKMACELH
jgi:hypothetical protein